MSTLKANTIKPVAVSTDLEIQTNDTTRMTLSATDGRVILPTNSPGIQFGDGMIQQYAGGKIRQIQFTETNQPTSTGSVSLVDISDLQVNITPRDANSKIYIHAMISMGASTADNKFALGLRRGSISIGLGLAGNNRTQGVAGGSVVNTDSISTTNMTYLDSPNSTSQLTYKVAYAARSGYTSYVNRTGNDSDSQYTVRPISTLTVMEVVTGA